LAEKVVYFNLNKRIDIYSPWQIVIVPESPGTRT